MWLKIGSWLTRFLGGVIPTGQKPFGDWLGKILWFVLLFALCTGFMNFLFPQKPQHQTTVGAGGTQIVVSEEPNVAQIGCTAWRGYVRIGIKSK